MEDVELIELGVAPDDEVPRLSSRARLRPLLRRWWPVPVAVVLAVTAVSVVHDSRQRAALARVRELPGVLTATVEPPLEAVAWGDEETLGVLYSGMRTADGLFVGPNWPTPGETAAVVALDPESGAERWRVDVEDPPEGSFAQLECVGDAEPATTAWCLRSTDASRSMLEVDLVRRVVGSTRPLPDSTDATVVGDLLVVAQVAADGVEVVATDLADGTRRWLTRVPSPAEDGPPVLWIRQSEDHLRLITANGQWWLDPADGSVEAAGQSVGLTRGGRLVTDLGIVATRLRGQDGHGDVGLPGLPLDTRPDDGSAPGVLVVQGSDGAAPVIRGVDVRTGAELWQRPTAESTWPSVILLDGVVYGADLERVWAVEAESGRERWSTPTASADEGRLITDGVHLLQVETGPEGRELVAYSLRSGARAWSAPLPEDLDWVAELGGLLVTLSGDGPVRVLR